MKDYKCGIPFKPEIVPLRSTARWPSQARLVFFVVPGFRTGTVEQRLFLNDRKGVIRVQDFPPNSVR